VIEMEVFVSFLKSPVGDTYYLEGLRIALGIMGGSEEHNVIVAFIGKGARCALKGVDRSYGKSLFELFQKDSNGKRFYVERESLMEQGITESELDEDFQMLSRDELRKKMMLADVTLSF
jgi:sulfur relay (sulfurtransferase) DsrF/TusC family protein